MKNIIIILLLVASSILFFNSCAMHSKEILVYKGKTDLELGDYCMMGGRILDKNTKKPLIGANIIFKSVALATATDKSGSYNIEKILLDIYDIRATFIGYKGLDISNFEFIKGNFYLIDFELLESEPSFHQD